MSETYVIRVGGHLPPDALVKLRKFVDKWIKDPEIPYFVMLEVELPDNIVKLEPIETPISDRLREIGMPDMSVWRPTTWYPADKG